MKTSDLIDSLSEDLAPTRKAPVSFYLAASLVAGTALALASAVGGLGPRSLAGGADLAFAFAKLMFAGSVVGIGALLVGRVAVPGRAKGTSYLLAFFPLAVFALGGLFELTHVPRQHWHEHVFGADWLLCLLAIPAIAVAPFALMVLTLRHFAAPTDLVRAGAFAGMTSGGISALAYAVHCTDDSLLFVASWYVAAIVICTLIGGALGPRVLRW